MKQRKNEIKMYQLHILHTSDLNEVMNQRFINSIKRHNGMALHPDKIVDPMKILSTLLFRNMQDRLEFYNENIEHIDMELDVVPVYVNKKYL